ncbi:MAG: SDR family oxidoreductase [Acidobacteriota bacterium]|nr:SDR family oxidoreductase [Acidobacteriota bacterium]
MSEPLAGRVAIVTGASAGIGRATAVAFARCGMTVALAARRLDRLQVVADAIAADGGRALAVQTDVAAEADVRALVARTMETYGRLDVMVCNAGFGVEGPIEAHTTEAMRRLLDVNYMGTFFAARAALPIFRQAGRGHLIVVSSIVGRRGAPYVCGYAATKCAQVGLIESLRAELAGTAIRVSGVYPVSTETEFADVMHAASALETQRPTGPHQSAETVAAAIVRCVRHPRPDVYPHAGSRLLPLLNWMAPQVTDRLMHRLGRKPRDDAR